VCVGGCLEEDELLDFLLRLIDKSLVFVTVESGEARYRLLETIRQYGTEKLKGSGEESAAWRRHAEFFLALAEELEPAMWGAQEAAWLSRLEAEHDNLRAALSWGWGPLAPCQATTARAARVWNRRPRRRRCSARAPRARAEGLQPGGRSRSSSGGRSPSGAFRRACGRDGVGHCCCLLSECRR
jgi:predicted ATPase